MCSMVLFILLLLVIQPTRENVGCVAETFMTCLISLHVCVTLCQIAHSMRCLEV